MTMISNYSRLMVTKNTVNMRRINKELKRNKLVKLTQQFALPRLVKIPAN